MRIYAIADIHGKKNHLAAIRTAIHRFTPDIIVAAGDISRFFNWRESLGQLERLPIKVLAIRGNTDPRTAETWMARAKNIRLLTPKPFQMGKFSFVGLSGTMVLPFNSRVCLRETRALGSLPCPMDPHTVLVAHPPPRGICDRVGGKIPAGSRHLARFIPRAGPGLMLCGHIHEAWGTGHLGATTIVNCSMGKACAGAIIDLEPGGPPRVNFLDPDRLYLENRTNIPESYN